MKAVISCVAVRELKPVEKDERHTITGIDLHFAAQDTRLRKFIFLAW